MTDTVAERTSAPQPEPAPEGVVGFGIAEMGFLVSRYAGEGRQKALDLLRLDDSFVDQPVTIAGASSLVARELAVAESGEDEADAQITLAGPAALLGYCFTNAVRWTALAFIHGVDSDAAFYVQTPTVAALLQPRAIGTWFAIFKSADGSTPELMKGLVEQNTDTDPTRAVYFGTSTRQDADNLFVRRTDAGWKLALVKDENTPAEERDTDDAGLLASLDRLLSVEG